MLRDGLRNFRRYMERGTGYASITDIAAHLDREESDIRHMATENSSGRGLPRYETEERAGVLFIRAMDYKQL